MTALLPDIQPTLQDATVEANNPTKERKRKHKVNDEAPAIDPEESEHDRKKRLKKQKKELARQAEEHIAPEAEVGEPPKKKKRKDKGKGKEKETADLNFGAASNEDSTAAFLSAIVAAASVTTSHDQNYTYQPTQFSFDLSTSDFPSFATNDDVIRAMNDMNVSKLTNVLKSLGEAQTVVGYQDIQAASVAPGQVPITAEMLLGTGKLVEKAKHRRTLDMSLPAPGQQYTSSSHAYLLANRWLNAGKLAELSRTEGLVFKKGKFSAIEEEQLKVAMENYRVLNSLTPEELNDVIFAKNDKKDNEFWVQLTTVVAVYHHIRRACHPMKQKGKWIPAEDESLKQAVMEYGQAWEKVSLKVGRMASDCRDRWRNHIDGQDSRVTGQWSKEEEDELTMLVNEMTVERGGDYNDEIFWERTDALSKTVKNEGTKPRWGPHDAYILVHKVDSLNVRDDTEIDWKTLSDPSWNLWSAHLLQRRWLGLKKGVKGYEDMTHHEIMDILRIKKAQPPNPTVSTSRKRKVVTSAAAVIEGDGLDGVQEAESSSIPATLGGGLADIC